MFYVFFNNICDNKTLQQNYNIIVIIIKILTIDFHIIREVLLMHFFKVVFLVSLLNN